MAIILLIPVWVIFSSLAHAEEVCPLSDSDAIIKIFDEAITLNNIFKKSVYGGNKSTYHDLRSRVDNINTKKVIPCVVQVSEVLSRHDKHDLSYKLLQLVVSYENSADENISYSLGVIFGANPEILESELEHFSADDRKVIMSRLEFGWINAKSKFSKKTIMDRDYRLKNLQRDKFR